MANETYLSAKQNKTSTIEGSILRQINFVLQILIIEDNFWNP